MYKAAGLRYDFENKADKGEREYLAMLHKMHRETGINEHLKHQLKGDLKTKQELQVVAQRHGDSEKKLSGLYRSIFDGPTPQFPEEDEAERRCELMVKKYRSASKVWQAEAKAVQLLVEGDILVSEALAQTQDALSYSRADVLGGDGGGIFDMIERDRLVKADRMVAMARLQVLRAQRLSPKVKELHAVEINHGHVFRELYFDDIFNDMAFHEKVKRGVSETQCCAKALRRELQAARERRDRLRDQLDCRKTELKDSRAALHKVRERVFEAVAQSPEHGSAGAAPRDHSDVPGDEERAEEHLAAAKD